VGFGETVRDYWLRRAEQHLQDYYAGLRISKFPEDLRVYEHLLWSTRPDVVIELGAQFGGSTLWFRDRLRALARYRRIQEPRVIAVDIEIEGARERIMRVDDGYDEDITLIAGDVRDPDLPAQVAAMIGDEARCLVIEDSAHEYDTTLAALRGFARFVPVGGFFVVEDGCVDVEEMRARPDWPRGVLPAIAEWLAGAQGREFVQRRDLELYGLSCHPQGFLQRHEPSADVLGGRDQRA
jgi:cephalosporin hydroxylase